MRCGTNLAVKWVAVLLLIRQVRVSDLGQENGVPQIFNIFLRLSRGVPDNYLKLGHGCVPSYTLN